MKKYFATGIAILLPIILTCLIMAFLLRILTKPFLGLTEQIFLLTAGHDNILASHPAIMHFLAQVLIATLIFFFLVGIGFAGQWVLTKILFRFGDRLIHTIPFVNKIYKAAQDIIESFANPRTTNFSQVVLVPFPSKKSRSIGFITRDGLPTSHPCKEEKLISVFVPGTPNPTMGFMLTFEKEQLTPINLKVEEAIKFVVSCGVILQKNEENNPIS